MTTPAERMRNLIQAGAFLKEIQGDESLPENLRKEAGRLLRHYPTISEFQSLAGNNPMLAEEVDEDWVKHCRFGAHT